MIWQLYSETQMHKLRRTANCVCPEGRRAGTEEVICAPMFAAALFKIAKRWKQPTHPLKDDG